MKSESGRMLTEPLAATTLSARTRNKYLIDKWVSGYEPTLHPTFCKGYDRARRALAAVLIGASTALAACSASAQPYVAAGIGAGQGDVHASASVGVQLGRFALEAGAVWLGDNIAGGRLVASAYFASPEEKMHFFGRLGVYSLRERTVVSEPCPSSRDRGEPCPTPSAQHPETRRDTAISYGVGAEYRFTPRYGMRVVFDRIESDLPSGSLNALGVDLVVRF